MNIYEKPIDRPINGVIQVGQLGDDLVRNELEEYVITHELSKYFSRFYRHYVEALEQPTDRVGVWISGFFGSGKSHFLKILSYLLENREVAGRRALDYFRPKVEDALLFAGMERSSEVTGDVILFNIDSKADADSKQDKEAIVQVFMKVFNDHLGFFGSAPYIADFERRLVKQGKYEAFQTAYERSSGARWQDERDLWDFQRDSILDALVAALDMSRGSAEELFEGLKASYSLSVERFAGIVNDYLAAQPPKHRVVFMVDEVGQYVGDNPDLMLNLQTVAEDLGNYCAGRAWVVVTSQEDIDALTKDQVRGQDFSKIQGRFATRLSLSSENTDEVIKLRLLEKTPGATDSLRALYATKEQVLKNQVRFSEGTALSSSYRDADDFVRSYPFVPYQFPLLQNVFTQVRLHGASGKHLSQGERSMLDAFQIAANRLKDAALGSLAPFHTFYGAVEGFLDGNIKRVISNAADNDRLEPGDADLLKVLFMVKYVNELKGTVENLTTLSLSHIDEGRVELKRRVEGALARLERETLIQRSGDVYEFLTNEEQDVGREIKGVQVNPAEVSQELQKIVWEEVFTTKQHRQGRNNYPFNRRLDELTYGQQTAELTLHLVTPYGDEYRDLLEDASALLRSGGGASALVRLPDDNEPFNELTTFVRTDKYVKQKNRDGLSPSLNNILQNHSAENQKRRARVVAAFQDLIAGSAVFVGGKRLERPGTTAQEVMAAGLSALVEKTYTKLSYVNSPFLTDAQLEQTLRHGPSAERTVTGDAPNALAQQDMLHWLDEQQSRRQTVTLQALDKTFTARPYGWTSRDVQGVLLELLVPGQAELIRAATPVDPKTLDVSRMWSRKDLEATTVRIPPQVDKAALRTARELARDYLGAATVPDEPQALFDLYRKQLGTKDQTVDKNLTRARQGYPFADTLERHSRFVRDLLAENSAATFFDRLAEREDAFEQVWEESEKVEAFYKGQLELFDRTRDKLRDLENDLVHLRDEALRAQVAEARRVLALPDPTADMPKLGGILEPVEARLTALRLERQEEAREAQRTALAEVAAFARAQALPENDLVPILEALERLSDSIDRAPTIDAATARLADVAARKQQASQAVIDRLNERAVARDSADNAATTPVKPIRSVYPARLGGNTLLESEADVTAYLNTLRDKLLAELNSGHRLRIE